MRFASLCSELYDLDGRFHLPVLSGSELRAFSRRIARSATLDGGASVSDGGYSAGDRTFVLQTNPDKSVGDLLRQKLQGTAFMSLATEEGVFRVVVEQFTPGDRGIELRLLSVAQL